MRVTLVIYQESLVQNIYCAFYICQIVEEYRHSTHLTMCQVAALQTPAYHNNTIPYAVKISVLRSWRWAKDCPKHVQLILEINKLLFLHVDGSSTLLYLHYYLSLSKYLPRCVTRAQISFHDTCSSTVNQFCSAPHFTVSDQLHKSMLTSDSPKFCAHLPVISLSFHPVVTVLLTTTQRHAFYTYPVPGAARYKM